MMKKALAYAMTAILVGIATMLAPLMLIEPGDIRFLASGDGENILERCPQTRAWKTLGEGEETFEEGEVLERAVSPSNLSSAGLMLVPSLLLALGVSLYLKKRMF